jgi:hypothetical protein
LIFGKQIEAYPLIISAFGCENVRWNASHQRAIMVAIYAFFRMREFIGNKMRLDGILYPR